MGVLRAAVLLAVIAVASCAPAGAPTPAGSTSAGAPTSSPQAERVLTISIKVEPNYIAAFAPLQPAGATDFWQRMFNAFLDLYDGQGRPHPYLAEALPVLNTESWTVFPDGRMETRYRLKPNLVWHDGVAMTADDFVFAFDVAKPSNGFRTADVPFTLIDDVVATDDRSFVIYWKGIYPDAGVLLLGDVKFGLVALPRHILEKSFDESLEAFQQDPYWSQQFVGAGPYKLDRWELGSHLEASAFDRHILGRPKIERVRLQFISDANTALANLLSWTDDVALDTLNFAQMLQLKQQWGPTGEGTAGFTVASFTALYLQHRSDYVSPRTLLDLRVHKALAHALDKKTLAETIWAGELAVLDTIFDPRADYYPAIDRAITKYPFDLQASQRLINEAGYTRGPDGGFVSPTEGKLTLNLQSPVYRSEPSVIAADLREGGFDIQEQPLSSTEERSPQVRGSFPALYIQASGLAEIQQMGRYRSMAIASSANNWRGDNNTGWSSPGFDSLVEAFAVTLDSEQRIQQRAAMAKIMSDELPAIMLTDNPNIHAFLARVKNVQTSVPYRTTGRITWNIEQWDLQ